MNKDVIYVEPEDDITDIILKIEKSKEKIVALVPPKKAGVFRSVVNIKLIAKAGATSNKTVVLVTVDPSIVKLAASTKLPVAKNLQSAPTIPTLGEDEENDSNSHEVLKESDDEDEEDEDEEESEEESKKEDEAEDEDEKDEEDDEEDEDDDGDDEDDTPKKAKSKKEPKKISGKKKGGIVGWLKNHKKMAIFLGVCSAGLLIFLVWAFVFAPAVDVQVSIKTEQKNFSQGISFTDNLNEESAKDGKFYLEQKKIDSVQEVSFEATGEKNRGEKASGEVIVRYSFTNGGSIPINQGTVFTVNGLNYIATESTSLDWPGWGDKPSEMKKNAKECKNDAIEDEFCTKTKAVKVIAEKSGTAYNIQANDRGWSSTIQATIWSENPMTGGTDDISVVVQQSDVERAKTELAATNEEDNKSKLYDSIDGKYYIIYASFEQATEDAIASPAVDEEVGEGVKPTLRATTTAMVYVIDKVKLEEFINSRAELEDNQKIYSIKDIYIEKISQFASGATGKLKAQYYVGPKITEAEVVDKIKGRGLGDAQRELRDVYGISDVKMNPSYPWVMAVPGDSNRINVHFEIKDQNGNEINKQEDGKEQDETEDNAESENKEESANEEQQ